MAPPAGGAFFMQARASTLVLTSAEGRLQSSLPLHQPGILAGVEVIVHKLHGERAVLG